MSGLIEFITSWLTWPEATSDDMVKFSLYVVDVWSMFNMCRCCCLLSSLERWRWMLWELFMTLVHLKMCNEHCAKFRMFMFLDAALFVIVCCVVVVVGRRVGKVLVAGGRHWEFVMRTVRWLRTCWRKSWERYQLVLNHNLRRVTFINKANSEP